MRDSRKMRTKYDLSLDNRQIVLIFLGFVLYSILILTLGVMVGKGLDLQQAVQQQAAEEKQAGAEVKIEVSQEEDKPEIKSGDQAPEAVTAEIAAEKPATTHVEYTFYDNLKGKGKGETEKQAVVEEPKKEAPAKVETKKESQQETAKPEKAKSGEAYTIQVASSKVKSQADSTAKRLVKKGYAAYVVSADVGGKGKWHRVRVGSFKTKEEATKFAKKLVKKEKLGKFVILKAD